MRGTSIPETTHSSFSTGADASRGPVGAAKPITYNPKLTNSPKERAIKPDINAPIMIIYMYESLTGLP